ncbi:MAG TPA: LacI family DNA-binding transcriptional regulator [Candidatus Limiplasma sp.]|nr:LacI family DNA-binding transcriptional regulator [Candidatus Limiplasma sp.]
MTIKQIADICGVSRGTVDRVLNGRGKVKPETEERILRTIRQLGYTKNIAGKALTLKKTTPVIGVLVSSEGNPFFDDVIEGFQKAEKELVDYGVTLILKTQRGYDVNRQLALMDELVAAGIAALVIQPINDGRIRKKINALAEQGIPTVTVNTDIENSSRRCYVGSDYTAGGVTAAGVMRIVTGGTANLGIVTGVSMLLGHDQRREGFERHIADVCPDINVVEHASAMDDAEHSYRMTMDMLKRKPSIDAIFIVAAGAEGVCRAVVELGRAESIRIVAFDTVPATVNMMRKGLVRAVICQQPLRQGYESVMAAFDILLSGAPKQGSRIIMEHQIKILENL